MQWIEQGRFIDQVSGQAERHSGVRQLHQAAWAAAWPTPVPAARIIAVDWQLADRLGLDAALFSDPGFTQVLGGSALYSGMTPWAANYGGHQFGHWAGQLGDGRALSLGELRDRQGRGWEIQLKGAGQTPFSRSGDGRAVLRSSLREYLASQAMAALGVPTTDALCLLTTGATVVRDVLYDGNPRPEPGAIVCRVAPSFLRFGSLQLPAWRGETELLQALVDFTVQRHYPQLLGVAEPAAALLAHVAVASAELVSHWQRVGFVHGVLNTDNMHLAGLTIDYGPFGWMEVFDPDYTPNTSDTHSRYCYAAQPAMVRWNLVALAQALAPLCRDSQHLADGLAAYDRHLAQCRLRDAAAKLGLPGGPEALALQRRWEGLMAQAQLDMSLAYRALARVRGDNALASTPSLLFANAITAPSAFAQAQQALLAWLADYRLAVAAHGQEAAVRAAAMNAVNPWLTPRNWLLHRAAQAAARNDLQPLQRLSQALQQPYVENPAMADLVAVCPPHLRQQPGCSLLSCSS
ncbi:hypothetical protein ABB25_07935 [Stenotrophomonas koreensis]|uniref:Protein nucleotidyltransferase YdiU n=1 Tax=Stenotrophomonas koreensis TaxID=266128 RepID=A0A0R0BLM0_9GAMM|nr:YdiU family protein [Stenotrophomonas koreensis]KRG58204.1 hypothetical protein ABB25_07935 [Stenotrophomonas koreensis]